ncbi:extracellular catalytic domain type 1 short-chain-length polyhydroxyalkanoate depolymerase [Sphingomonas sediminicola]|uniref:extracellular catalytic domain type 1 short-chain-length polyhydroxyalkanoate depolymerase n=1 Tax=Sphingomonas sediminicola TaxID=386874 RepID=UPI003CCCE4D9
MVAEMQARHGTDPARVYITGLSAGGAMAAVMLATYPDVFAGGGIIAGLPFGTAQSIPEAFDRMRGQGSPAAGELSQIVRSASSHSGPWPTLSVWHGSSDRTVDPRNAADLVHQWGALHGVGKAPTRTDHVSGYPIAYGATPKGERWSKNTLSSAWDTGRPSAQWENSPTKSPALTCLKLAFPRRDRSAVFGGYPAKSGLRRRRWRSSCIASRKPRVGENRRSVLPRILSLAASPRQSKMLYALRA